MTTTASQAELEAPGAPFRSSLLDAQGQPELVFGGKGPYSLVWTLVNVATGTGQDLVITPFEGGAVGPGQYHFVFAFSPPALTAAPTVPGWEVATELDAKGAVKSLYLALSGSTALDVPPGGSTSAKIGYTTAIRENSGSPQLSVALTAGGNVTQGGAAVAGREFGPFSLSLAAAATPPRAAAPRTVDIVGRRSVLNDGLTRNAFTFAITNLTTAALPLADTVFTVWFDAAPNDDEQPYWWALAKIQELDSNEVVPTAPTGWTAKKLVADARAVAGNPQWTLTPPAGGTLDPQSPLLVTFTGIVTALPPGVTRMYLKFQGLPSYADGMLMAELEKSPLSYGPATGDGLYLSAGTPSGTTPPSIDYQSGLFVRQSGSGPAATLTGGTGLLVRDTSGPAATLDGAVVVVGGPGPALQVTGSTTLAGALQVTGDSTLTGALTVTGKATVDSLSVTHDAGAATLGVAGKATAGSLQVNGEATVGGPLTALSGAKLEGTVAVPGPTQMLGSYKQIDAGTVLTASTDGLVFATALPPGQAWPGMLQGIVNGAVISQAAGGYTDKTPIPIPASVFFAVPRGARWEVSYNLLSISVGGFHFPTSMPKIDVWWIPFGTQQGA